MKTFEVQFRSEYESQNGYNYDEGWVKFIVTAKNDKSAVKKAEKLFAEKNPNCSIRNTNIKEIKEEAKDSKNSALADIIEQFISNEVDFNEGIKSLTKAINEVLIKKYKCGVGNTDCSQFVTTFGDAEEIIPQSLNYKIARKLILN